MNPETGLSLWKPYQPTAQAPWNLERAVHLHRRAALAAPWSVLKRDLAGTPREAVDRLLAAERNEAFESLAHTIGEAALSSDNSARLKAWWFYRMLLSPDPLTERLALMWHNHFATSNAKVRNAGYMLGQYDLMRRHALGSFRELLQDMSKDPAMLVWLDSNNNVKGKPNHRLVTNLFGDMNVINKMFGWDSDVDRTRKLAYALSHPLKPVEISQSEAPCQEHVIEKPNDVNDHMVPIRHTTYEPELTVGSGIRCVTGRHFEGGSDLGYNRMNFRWGNVGTFQISPGSHMWQVVNKYYKADEPVPMTATRCPEKSTPSCGQYPV